MKEKVDLPKADGYGEIFQGAGTASTQTLMEYTAVGIYESDPMAKRIVDVIPEEMVSPGFGLDGDVDEKEFKSLWDSMNIQEDIIEALCWERLHGGAGILAMINDGKSMTSPATPGNGILESIRVYEKDQIKVDRRVKNPRNSRYGMPEIYEISTSDGGGTFRVHYTRFYVLWGDRATRTFRNMNKGFGLGVLVPKMIEAIRDYNYCEELVTQLLRRKQQAVWKARGLAMLCDDDEGVSAARIRLAQVDDNGGVGRAVGIDATDEDYTVLNSDVSGVGDVITEKLDRLVSYSGIHEIILKNKNVGGVSASQNTALETFYKMIDRKRNAKYRPILEWILPYIIQDEQWSIRFDPLSMPSEKEQSETVKNYADTIIELIDGQVIDPEEGRDTLEAISDVFKLKKNGPDLTLNPDNASASTETTTTGITPDKATDDEGNQDS